MAPRTEGIGAQIPQTALAQTGAPYILPIHTRMWRPRIPRLIQDQLLSTGSHMNSKCRRFEGKIALVTGAANGFGRATVHRLVDEGLDTVFIVDREVDGAQKELA